MATDYSEFNARKRSGNSAGAAQRDNGSASSSQTPAYRNAVLDDYELQAGSTTRSMPSSAIFAPVLPARPGACP